MLKMITEERILKNVITFLRAGLLACKSPSNR
jgi:hypothetical protein